MQMTGLGGGNADVFNTGSAGGLSGLGSLLSGHKQQQSSRHTHIHNRQWSPFMTRM